jgi:hypothetical protein
MSVPFQFFRSKALSNLFKPLLIAFILCVCSSAGCGGGSSAPPISVNLSPSSAQTVQQGQTVSVAATLANDLSSKGVTWSLTGTGCTGAGCGALTNQTSTSATYNAPTSIPSDLAVTVTAASVADPSKSASIAITVPSTVVTIQNKVTELAAGTANHFFGQFIATVQNDPADGGVTWTLTANGAPCSPACGTLSSANIFTVNYAPPSSVPAAPDNMPAITATSVSSPTRSDTNAFTIFDGSAACGTGGNESLLNGEYAILLQGWIGSGTANPLLFGASFAADGTGKITGGADQFNPLLNHSYSGFGLIPSASSYSVGPDNRGCLTLTDQFDTTFTFHFSLGGVTGGIASKGDIIFFNEQSATPERGAGILRRQDPTAFSLSALASNYAFGVDGWENSKGPITHFALAGSFAQSGGALSNPALDFNDGGHLGTQQAGGLSFGAIQPVATLTGTTYATLTVPGLPSDTANVTVYVINSSELFFISNDLGAAFSGRAIASPSSFSPSSVSPNYIFHFTGNSSGAASVSIGLVNFSGGISGTVSGTMDHYAGGAATNQSLTGSYAFTQLYGRMGITGSSAATSPICYLTNPFDGVSAFCIGTDSSATFGVFDTQPTATYGSSSLSGNFYFGSSEPGDNTVPDLSGVASISSGSLTGTKDTSATAGLSLGSAFKATLSINADGTGNLGANTVIVTNGTVLYFIDETATSPTLVQVFEQ